MRKIAINLETRKRNASRSLPIRVLYNRPQNALRHSNFDHEFTYTQDASQRTRRNRQRNIIGFNPPFSKSVNTNIGRNS